MFQPQPTAFSTFYSDFIPSPIDDSRDQGLAIHRERHGSYSQPEHSSFNNFQQAHFGPVGVGATPSGGINLGPSPSVGSSGPSVGLGPVPGPGPGGLVHGGAVATPAGVTSTGRASISTANAPLSAFSLHGALPHPQQPTPSDLPNLFDHEPTSVHDLHQLRRNLAPFRDHPAAPRDMEQNPSFSDDLAAQEAAARTWQPELEVRSNIIINAGRLIPQGRCTARLGAAPFPSANGFKLWQGPRVGEKTPINAITAEYAKADPVYVAKTMVS